MKTFKDTQELAGSEDLIYYDFKEKIIIGNMSFEIYLYVVEDDDYSQCLWGCFHIENKSSPVFESISSCLRYAIHLYNENLEKKEYCGQNLVGNPVKNR